MDSYNVREKKLINSNFRLLSKDLEKLSFDVNPEANIAKFSREVLRQTIKLIGIYWRILRNRGVTISLESYKTSFKQYLLFRSDEFQRTRRMEFRRSG